MTPIQIMEIIFFIALFVYFGEKIYREYECFAQCIRDVIAIQDIFKLSRCRLGEDDYAFQFTNNVPEKRQDAVYIMLDFLYKKGAIFSLEEEGKAFVPQIHRDKFLIEMGTILSGVNGMLEDYERTDALWQALFRRPYNKLKEVKPKFDNLYKIICSMEAGRMFCTPVEL